MIESAPPLTLFNKLSLEALESGSSYAAGQSAISKELGMALAFLWGIGQHLPYQNLYVAGIGAGDVLFLLYLSLEVGTRWQDAGVIRALYEIRQFAWLVLLFVLLTLVSGTVNALRTQMLAKDLIETLRPLYYLAMTAFVVAWVKDHGLSQFIVAFLGGILFVALVNYFYGDDAGIVVFGFKTMYNPNLMGNMIGVGVFLSSLLFLSGWIVPGATYVGFLLVLSLFTYSKGAWLMSVLGVLACALATRTRRKSTGRRKARLLLAYTALGVVAGLGIHFREEIGLLLAFKLRTTQLESTAAEGGTVAQRWSFVRASTRMVMDHPLVGIGISNYENEYDRLREYLGAAYHPTDNPHSAFLYILACTGLPAFAVFFGLFLYPFCVLFRLLPLGPGFRVAYTSLAVLIFALNASVQIELLSQPFFWVFVGLVLGWAIKLQQLIAAREPHGRSENESIVGIPAPQPA